MTLKLAVLSVFIAEAPFGNMIATGLYRFNGGEIMSSNGFQVPLIEVLGRKKLVAAALFIAGLQSNSVWAGTSVLFVGNSFTSGYTALQYYRAGTITDTNGTGYGGIPAIFKAMTERVGLAYDVSVESMNGSNLDAHYRDKLAIIGGKSYDKVVFQAYSTLDAANPGDPQILVSYSGLLADAVRAQNSVADISLFATWARADMAYQIPGTKWYGQPVATMANDLQTAYEQAKTTHSPRISRVIPVGMAWNLAMDRGVADSNPYDSIVSGINLWADDGYHPSRFGGYLEALVLFSSLTGIDPRTLGRNDPTASELGISGGQASALQTISYDALNPAVRRGKK